jgi:probable HAF family extracellular repeat protein
VNPVIVRRGRSVRRVPLSTHLLGTALVAFAASGALGAEVLTFDGTSIGNGQVFGVSADGKVVVGFHNFGAGGHAFRWNGTILEDLGTLDPTAGAASRAMDASADGAVVVGSSTDAGAGPARAFRWTSGGGMVDLGSLGGTHGQAQGVSADGSVVVGNSSLSGDAVFRAFRWTSGTGMVDLGTLGGDFTAATDVSADGAVVVGIGTNSSNQNRAFRWSGGTMVDINGSNLASSANAVSADGTVVVGKYSATVLADVRASRWQNGVMHDLGILPGAYESEATGVSADGTVIVGTNHFPSEKEAFRWNAVSGMQSIEDLLTASGVDVTGWSLRFASAVSGDGTVIAGSGYAPSTSSLSAWILRCVANCAVITVAGTAQSFAGHGAMGATGSALLGTELGAAGDMAAAAKSSGTPITGFAYGAFDSDPTTSATVGATFGLGNDLVIGASLGAAGILTYLPFGGSSTFAGASTTAFVASTPNTGLNWMAGGAVLGLSGTVTRGYLNGNTPVTSTGTTTGSGAGFTAEAGWTFDDLIADTLVTPFVNVSLSSMSYAGYTETGGPFPATFSAFTTISAIVRVGVDGRYQFQEDSYLSAGLSYAHNFGNGGTISGNIPGIFAVSTPGDAPVADFVEASIGLDMPITETVQFYGRVAAIVPFAGTASVQARAGVRMAF